MSSSENDPGLPKAIAVTTFRKKAFRFLVRAVPAVVGIGVIGGLIMLAVTKARACDAKEARECASFDGASFEIARFKRLEGGRYVYYTFDPATKLLDEGLLRTNEDDRVDIHIDVPPDGAMRIDMSASYDRSRCDRYVSVHLRSADDIE